MGKKKGIEFGSMIARIIDATTKKCGRDAVYDDYVSVARKLYPKEMRKLGASFARNGFIKWLKDGMRRAENLDESDPNAPQVQLDLPGLSAPGYINIGSNNAPKLVRFADAIVEDLDVAIANRFAVVTRVNARVEDLQQKREWLVANRTHDEETVGEVCRRLSVEIVAAQPIDAGGDACHA